VLVILTHQFAVAFYIGAEDGSQLSLHAIISQGFPQSDVVFRPIKETLVRVGYKVSFRCQMQDIAEGGLILKKEGKNEQSLILKIGWICSCGQEPIQKSPLGF
jgi:hypothetical protein